MTNKFESNPGFDRLRPKKNCKQGQRRLGWVRIWEKNGGLNHDR